MKKVNTLITFVSVLFLSSSCSSSPQEKQVNKASIDNLIPDLNSLCEGHITGAPSPGKAPPHILWKTFTSDISTKDLVSKYTKQLGSPPNEIDKECSSWTFKEDITQYIFKVCPEQKAFLSDSCSKPPTTSKSIINHSAMIN